MKILLVEDNPLCMEQVRDAIQSISDAVIVHVATTEKDACRWLAEHPDGWDLAIVDLFLKEGHGFNVLRCCSGRRSHQRAVVLSNYAIAPVHDYVRQAGADAFFDKTHGLDGLLAFAMETELAA